MATMPPQILFSNVVATKIQPLEKTAHVESIEPTDNDFAVLDFYIPTLFAYRLADNSDAVYVQAVNRIKEGLQKVLVPFFPWAGRWVATPGGMHRQLLCNDEGVPFIEAYVDKSMDSLVRFSVEFQPITELQGWEVVGTNETTQRMTPDGLPCIFVQVTRFKCGGLALGVTFAHMLADGKSFFHFMTAWSDFSRRNRTDKILDHNRGAVQPSTPRPLPAAEFDTAQDATGKQRIYEVNKSVIESLKREVKESADGAYVSTNDCIFAHILKTFSIVPLSITGGKQILLGYVVEGRTRFFDHPVPDLVGNILTTMSPPKISTAELANMPVSLIARKIREKITTTARETWLSPESLRDLTDPDPSRLYLPITSWTSFPMYSIDYGFGNPLFVTGLNHHAVWKSGSLVAVHPPTPSVLGSSACVTIQLSDQYLELHDVLDRRHDFLSFFLRPETVKSCLAGHL